MFGKPKPSQYLRRHVASTGSGFELDDLLSWHEGDPKYQDVIDAVFNLMREHNDQGLGSAEAKAELERLAFALEEQGR